MPSKLASFLGAASLASVLALTGCSPKSACEAQKTEPVAFPWQSNQDLVPPGGRVCGVQGDDHGALLVSFPKDANPLASAISHLESKGWTRSGQDASSGDAASADLKKDNQIVHLSTTRASGYEPAVTLQLSDKDCSRATAKDSTACRRGKPAKIIKCEAKNWVADGPVCADDELCLTSIGPKMIAQGDTAKCFKR